MICDMKSLNNGNIALEMIGDFMRNFLMGFGLRVQHNRQETPLLTSFLLGLMTQEMDTMSQLKA